MKMRLKQPDPTRARYERLAAFTDPHGRHRLILWTGDASMLVNAEDYEPVPETRWRPITEEVEVSEDGRTIVVGGWIVTPTLPEGYRFVKRVVAGYNYARTTIDIEWDGVTNP